MHVITIVFVDYGSIYGVNLDVYKIFDSFSGT